MNLEEPGLVGFVSRYAFGTILSEDLVGFPQTIILV